jgi:hypothetical protein
MAHNASLENKAGSAAGTTHSDTKINIPGRFSATITFV